MNPIPGRWEQFQELCEGLRAKHGQGRSSLRRQWSALRRLFEEKVRPQLTQDEVTKLLGKNLKELDPEENDLKALAAHAAGRGVIEPGELRAALDFDLKSSPLFFLAGLSGKTFGETVAPELCAFWLKEPRDGWEKKSNRELFDVAWSPDRRLPPLRIELKASSEAPAFRFQQVRDPRAGGAKTLDYDALLCMGVTASTLEFWLIPAGAVIGLIDTEVLEPQHGGSKAGLASNTYWFVTDVQNRTRLSEYAATPQNLRNRAADLHSRLARA